MADAVLDSSAILAVILEEPGAQRVEAHLPGGRVSAANVGEVVAKLRDLGMPEPTANEVMVGCSSTFTRTICVPLWQRVICGLRPGPPVFRSVTGRALRWRAPSGFRPSLRIAAGSPLPTRSAFRWS